MSEPDWRLAFPEVDQEQLADYLDEQPALRREARPDPPEYMDDPRGPRR